MDISTPPDFGELQRFLFDLRNAGSKFSLERIRKISQALGSPEKNYPKIHIAGTNGKGSTCAMLESICRASGMKTGMYTSPHLLYLGERIQIDRVPVGKTRLMELLDRVLKVCDCLFSRADMAEYPSFFEVMTAAAFLHFAEEKVDVGIIEVGLGGRLDSTNIITPNISVITTIGLDHTQYLGNTIAEIAAEKAGIIKKSVPVVAGFLQAEAFAAIESAARRADARLYSAGDFFKDESEMPKCALEGAYQRRNAAVASLCARVLASGGGPFKGLESFIPTGLERVSWAARWQKIPLKNNATLILDASHNPEGAEALRENLQALKESGVAPIVTVGVLGRERAKALLSVIAEYAKKIVFLVPDQPRALSFEELEALTPKGVSTMRAKVQEVYSNGKCLLAEDGDVVVSTGSIYLAGEVLSSLYSEPKDSMSDLI